MDENRNNAVGQEQKDLKADVLKHQQKDRWEGIFKGNFFLIFRDFYNSQHLKEEAEWEVSWFESLTGNVSGAHELSLTENNIIVLPDEASNLFKSHSFVTTQSYSSVKVTQDVRVADNGLWNAVVK